MANQVQVEAPQDAGAHSDTEILDVQRAFDVRPDHRMAEHIRILFALSGKPRELRASISWESLAQLRSEMARAGKHVSDDDVLGLVLVPWAMDLVANSFGAVADEVTLDFGDSPRPPAVRETLLHYGLLP